MGADGCDRTQDLWVEVSARLEALHSGAQGQLEENGAVGGGTFVCLDQIEAAKKEGEVVVVVAVVVLSGAEG